MDCCISNDYVQSIPDGEYDGVYTRSLKTKSDLFSNWLIQRLQVLA